MWFCDLINTMMHNQGSLHCRFVFTVFKFPHLAILTIRLQHPPSPSYLLFFLLPPTSSSARLCLTLSPLCSVCPLSFLPTSSALRSCSTGDSLLSSAFIRSAKSAPALAPPLPVLLHHHHPLLPPLADQLAGTHSLHYLPALLSARRPPTVCSSGRRLGAVRPVCVSVCLSWIFARGPAGIGQLRVAASAKSKMLHPCRHLLDVLHVTDGSFKINTERI